ncbi:MAG: hypothetical protein ACOYNZ_10410 [Rhodoferax sp.]
MSTLIAKYEGESKFYCPHDLNKVDEWWVERDVLYVKLAKDAVLEAFLPYWEADPDLLKHPCSSGVRESQHTVYVYADAAEEHRLGKFPIGDPYPNEEGATAKASKLFGDKWILLNIVPESAADFVDADAVENFHLVLKGGIKLSAYAQVTRLDGSLADVVEFDPRIVTPYQLHDIVEGAEGDNWEKISVHRTSKAPACCVITSDMKYTVLPKGKTSNLAYSPIALPPVVAT